MSNQEKNNVPKTNGAGIDLTERLATFKPPRDYTLGGAKPNKKVFTPNLNVSRNKTKGPSSTGNKEQKKEDKGKRERKFERNRNGSNIIKSTGVFSEGLGSGQRQSSRGSYHRDGESAAPVLQRPTIRVKDVIKIDKELEEQKIRAVMSRGTLGDDDNEDFKDVVDKNAPIKLPMDDGGWSVNQGKKQMVQVKKEVMVKIEPEDPGDIGGSKTIPSLSGAKKPVVDMSTATPEVDTKPIVNVKKEVVDNSDLVDLLRTDQPTLLLVKMPDTLPGRGTGGDDTPPQRKPKEQSSATPSAPSTTKDEESKLVENRCHLKQLEEGKLGKLMIHRSGKVTLALGKTTFEVSLGTKSAFHQEVVSVAVDEASRSARLVALGPLLHKLNVVPDWETMFQEA